jgi:Tol biopolymer transport system component
VLFVTLAVLAFGGLAHAGGDPQKAPADPTSASAELATSGSAVDAPQLPRGYEPDPREVHFSTLTMLTDGGENAEAYFSYDGSRLVFQTTRPPYECDQIMVMPVAGGQPKLVSTGKGRTTCAYFTGDDQRIIYASTHLASEECPPPPDMSRGYVWALYPGYDIFSQDLKTGDLLQLTTSPGYDAEATISPSGDKIVFTSVRDGDLEIYTMKPDGSEVTRLTHEPGYDGGPFFSPDGQKIVYRAGRPENLAALADYRKLLSDNLVRPSRMEIWVMDADGANKRQITDLGCASFAPFFLPSGEKIIFSSNHPEPGSREFELWLIDLDGQNLEQVTFSAEFDGFPMFSPDGESFVFCSNRHHAKPGETNVFVTKWVD